MGNNPIPPRRMGHTPIARIPIPPNRESFHLHIAREAYAHGNLTLEEFEQSAMHVLQGGHLNQHGRIPRKGELPTQADPALASYVHRVAPRNPTKPSTRMEEDPFLADYTGAIHAPATTDTGKHVRMFTRSLLVVAGLVLGLQGHPEGIVLAAAAATPFSVYRRF